MEKTERVYETYVKILKRELLPAMGCTEPIAVAYCAAAAGKLLGEKPSAVRIEASGNIIKNVKSVIVPHTGGLRGMEAAAAVGILYGQPEKKLEVISAVTEEQAGSVQGLMKEMDITVSAMDTPHVLDLRVSLQGIEHEVSVRIQDAHTSITEMIRDGVSLECREEKEETSKESEKKTFGKAADSRENAVENKGDALENSAPDYSLLTVAGILDFARTADMEDVREVLERQIRLNSAIAREGLTGKYGARIGCVLLKQDSNVRTLAKAMAAAGSDARMNGCELPVVINSGSGNQGLTASLPVITYAEHYRKTEEELYRALLVSNLVTLHLKAGIGRLSAYCGAVSAGAGAGAGIAFLLTGDDRVVNHTIVNALAITSGMVCDGAKASCAAKIALSVEAGIMGFEMYQSGSQFYDGDGLVSKGVENTIQNISALGHDGMKETDKKIIEIMCSAGKGQNRC